MSVFASINDAGEVTQLIVAEQDFIDSLPDADSWVQANEAVGIGYAYDANTHVFIPPKPYPSWTLDSVTNTWSSPIPKPTDEKTYRWDEPTQSWVETPEYAYIG